MEAFFFVYYPDIGVRRFFDAKTKPRPDRTHSRRPSLAHLNLLRSLRLAGAKQGLVFLSCGTLPLFSPFPHVKSSFGGWRIGPRNIGTVANGEN